MKADEYKYLKHETDEVESENQGWDDYPYAICQHCGHKWVFELIVGDGAWCPKCGKLI